jgi:hypothetical protein
MRPTLLLAVLLLSTISHAQPGLGVAQSSTLVDEELSGPVSQVIEKFYYGEEEVLTRAQLQQHGPWITSTSTFQGGRRVRQETRGGRTDGASGWTVTTNNYSGPCLQSVRVEDRTTRERKREQNAETREDVLTLGQGCQPTESVESLFGKPSLRKAYVWSAGRVEITAYRKDNSVAYRMISTCLNQNATCEETTTSGSSPVLREVTRWTRSAAGVTTQRRDTRFVGDLRQEDSVYDYDARGWMTAAAFLNTQSGVVQPGKLYRYPTVDKNGNWTAKETYRIDQEFGKRTLGLIEFTTRSIQYTR